MLYTNKKFSTDQIKNDPNFGGVKNTIIADCDGVDALFNGSWEQYVSYQPSTKRDKTVYHLTYKVDDDGKGRKISLEVDTHALSVNQYIYTDDTIESAVIAVLESFSQVEVKNNFELNSACIRVAAQTRRGPANHNWGNVWYYMGTSKGELDSGFIVSSIYLLGERLYAIWKADKFDSYGFTIKRNDRIIL